MSRSIRDRAVANVEEVLDGYVNDSITFEIITFPYPAPNDPSMMMFGIIIGLFMPTPNLAGGEHFFVSQQFMELLMLDNKENVEKILFNMIQVLRGQKADWLKGN